MDLSKKKKIKTMNSKMTTNSQLSTLNLKNKNKLRKQLEQEQNNKYGDPMDAHQWGRERGENGCGNTGNKKHNW